MATSAPADSFFVYILQCSDGALYVGHTRDVAQRIKLHNDGRGALWTASRRPVKLIYHELASFQGQIKRWSHDKKLALISGDLRKLKSLAKRRVR